MEKHKQWREMMLWLLREWELFRKFEALKRFLISALFDIVDGWLGSHGLHIYYMFDMMLWLKREISIELRSDWIAS